MGKIDKKQDFSDTQHESSDPWKIRTYVDSY
jgi:hypothetical protein